MTTKTRTRARSRSATASACASHQAQRLLEAKSLHELGWRRSDKGLEHAVEVERREHRALGKGPAAAAVHGDG